MSPVIFVLFKAHNFRFVYVIFLPDLKMQKYLRMAAMRIQIMEDRLEQLEDTQKEMD